MAPPHLLLLLPFMAFMATTHARHGGNHAHFLAVSCSTTQYPKLCHSTLMPHAAAIRSNHVRLARTALNLTHSAASTSLAVVTRMAASGCGDRKPLEVAAVRDCKEMMSEAVDELRRSIEVMAHLGGQFLGDQIANMQTWVSAALTNENCCVDGLGGPSVKSTRDGLTVVLQMTSNALCFINALVSH